MLSFGPKSPRKNSLPVLESEIDIEKITVSVEEKKKGKLRTFSNSPNTNYQNNKVSHQKYTILNLIPMFLFLQFRFFFNFFYLIITLTQFVPIYRIGFLVTYLFPLLFVLSISLIKELWDEYQRWKRDRELNLQEFDLITASGQFKISSQDLRVGHIITIHSGSRVPADLILLKTSDPVGTSFIKTTQLDGETDWKLRRSLPFAQVIEDLFSHSFSFETEPPNASIYEFSGKVVFDGAEHSIGVDSTIWADAVVACGSIIGIVVYSGSETRSSMNGTPSSPKIGKVDREINRYSSILFVLLFLASFIASSLNGFGSNFHVLIVRFVLLFSFIIPISMKINLDVSKMIFSYRISHDHQIEGSIMRNSNIPEELGRIEYIFTDKTGTLTKNEMDFKKLQIDNNIIYGNSTIIPQQHQFAVLSLALCHSVTVTQDGFQSSSPDEIALVKQAGRFGYTLVSRDENSMTIVFPNQAKEIFSIMAILPFSSVWKHMGIVISNKRFGTMLICKGADTSISRMCPPSEWLDEVVGNLAREGLRTLVYSSRTMSDNDFSMFMDEYQKASTSVVDRGQLILQCFRSIENDMLLLGVTGVEDKLQENVPETLETLGAANIKIWMLTGDKLETAICVALSSRLITRDTDFVVINSYVELFRYLEDHKTNISPLVIDGTALQQAIEGFPSLFLSVASKAPSVVVCRCSPSQKESVVRVFQNFVTCAVGDGGNDVSMIQAASIGIGIVGKEGKQASLAADCSINTFSHLRRLILWHGTNNYKHSSRLAQFVMHRGVIMTATQAIYSFLFNIVPVPFYNDWLMMGFATFFTSFPVISLIFDVLIEANTIMAFPELYTKCQRGRFLSAKTFIGWTWLAIYQGSVIVLFSVIGSYDYDFRRIQSTAFSSMIITELILIGININHFCIVSITSEILSIVLYIISIFILSNTFDIPYIFSWQFIFKVSLIISLCIIPLSAFDFIKKTYSPTHEEQLQSLSSNGPNGFLII